jgi:hypothetical protein
MWRFFKKIYMTIGIFTRSLKCIIHLIVSKITVIQNYFGIYFGILTVIPGRDIKSSSKK